MIYSKSKLSSQEDEELTRFLDGIQYTCGDTFHDLTNSNYNGEDDSIKNYSLLLKLIIL